MFDKFVPDMYSQSIYRINYKKLADKGIKCIIFDLDNTISPVDVNEPSKEAIDLMFDLKDLGMRPILMSNSPKKRVDSCASAAKPFSKNYKKILEVYKLKPEEVACVGDQLLTDILGANKMGLTSILINPISKKDRLSTYVNRVIEKIIMVVLDKRDLFKKGKYYD